MKHLEKAVLILGQRIDFLYSERRKKTPGSKEWKSIGGDITRWETLLSKAYSRRHWFYGI